MKRALVVVLGLVFSLNLRGISLEECYRLSRENYPMIRQYDVVDKLAGFSFSNASRGYLPQLGLYGEASYQNDVPRFPDGMGDLFSKIGYDFKGLSRDQYKVMLQLSQLIWDGGVVKGQKEAVEAEAKVSRLNVEKELDRVKERINQIYFGILILKANLQINQEAEKLLNDNLRLLESGIRNGLVLSSDKECMEVELLTLQQQQAALEHSLMAYRQVLSLMIGREVSDADVFEIPRTVAVQGENRRVELAIFDAESARIRADKRMVDASVMPRFDLYARGWYGRPGLNLFEDMMYDRMSWNYVAGIRMQWNISGFYTKKNNMQKISLSQQSVENRKNTFLWEMSLNESRMRNEIDKMNEVRRNDARIIELRKSIRKASESRYRNGVITVNDLLEDITDEKNAEQVSSLHELELLKNIYDLKVMLNQ